MTSEAPRQDPVTESPRNAVFASPLLICALAITGAIAAWGLARLAAGLVHTQFVSRG